MTAPGPFGLIDELAPQPGETDPENGGDQIQPRYPAQRLLPRGLVVPVEANVGPGPGGGPHAGPTRGQPACYPRAGLPGRAEDENLMSSRVVHAFMITGKDESFNDLD